MRTLQRFLFPALAGFGLLLLASGCASTPSREAPPSHPSPAEAPREPRTELLLLNVPEASGWVAYSCPDQENDDVEPYRIVVIRESDNTVIYESQVPLTSSLCTHSFEMAEDDPRLQAISGRIDQDIIQPLEAYHRAAPPPTLDEDDPATSLPVAPELENVLTGVEVLDSTEDTLILGQGGQDLLAVGQRLFLRTPPEYLEHPSTGEQMLLSRGSVAAMLEVTHVDNSRVTATLRSGEIPPAGYLEFAE